MVQGYAPTELHTFQKAGMAPLVPAPGMRLGAHPPSSGIPSLQGTGQEKLGVQQTAPWPVPAGDRRWPTSPSGHRLCWMARLTGGACLLPPRPQALSLPHRVPSVLYPSGLAALYGETQRLFEGELGRGKILYVLTN